MQATTFKKALSREEVADLLRELDRQSKAKMDLIAPGSKIRMVIENGEPKLVLAGAIVPATRVQALYEQGVARGIAEGGATGVKVDLVFDVARFGHRGLIERLSIPGPYYERMRSSALDLLATSVNTWFDVVGQNHMLRTLNGAVRSVRSDSYKAVDNSDIAFSTLPIIREAGGEVVRMDLAEDSFFLSALQYDWAETIEPGHFGVGTYDLKKEAMKRLDPNWDEKKYDETYGGNPNAYGTPPAGGTYIVPGIMFGNSEVGTRSYSGQIFAFDLVCGNRTLAAKGVVDFGNVMGIHAGAKKSEGLIDWGDDVRRKEVELALAKLKAAARTAFDRDKFRLMIDAIRKAQGIPVAAPVEAVAALAENVTFLSDADKEAILNEFVSPQTRGGQDLGRTLYGLSAAVTARAAAYEDPERQIEFETLGGQIIEYAFDPISGKVRELVPLKAR